MIRRKNIRKILLLFLFLLSFLFLNKLLLIAKRGWITVTYAIRPLWDFKFKQEFSRWDIIPFLGNYSLHSCELHKFTPISTRKLYDAFLFNSEIDLLEIRIQELDPFVEKFIIIESDCSFAGKPKKLYFQNEFKLSETYKKYSHKIIHFVCKSYHQNDTQEIKASKCKENFTFWTAEGESRKMLVDMVRSQGKAQNGDLIHLSDLDEIPKREVLDLLKKCDFGSKIHLALDTFRYSFEFRIWPEYVFRSSVSVLNSDDSHVIERFGDYSTTKLLGGAGWHCTFCIKSLDDIIKKMVGYSHNDRLDLDPESTNLEILQERVCKGKDPFGYPPEAVDFTDLITMWNPPKPMLGASNIPITVLENPERYRFLLPGGCKSRSTNTDL